MRSSGTGSRSAAGFSTGVDSLPGACVADSLRTRGLAAKCRSSHSSAVPKSTPARCITRSIAPPPPWQRRQLVNLGPVTDKGPCSVCHLDLSCRSRSAPRKTNTVSSGTARTAAAAAQLVEVHSASLSPPSSSLGRKLWQFFMLITWLVSVSRLSKAPVSWLFFSSAPHSLKPRFEVISVVLVL